MGPHCGAMVANPEFLESLSNDKLLPSTMVVPERFEFGTLPYEIMAGFTAAIDYTASLDSKPGESRRNRIISSMNSLHAYEAELFEYMEQSLAVIDGVKLYGHANNRTPTLFFSITGVASADVYRALAEKKLTHRQAISTL